MENMPIPTQTQPLAWQRLAPLTVPGRIEMGMSLQMSFNRAWILKES
jgi:hypothetical protein